MNIPARGPVADGVDNDGDTQIDETGEGADDEDPDAWPFDLNDDQRASLVDILRFIPVFNAIAPDPPYSPRFDLNTADRIGLGDVLKFVPAFNETCVP